MNNLAICFIFEVFVIFIEFYKQDFEGNRTKSTPNFVQNME